MTDFERGDLVMVSLDPQSGHEIMKRRPCLVISNLWYNEKSSFLIVCPITSKDHGWAFSVRIDTQNVSGFVMVDQIKSIDPESRSVTRCEGAPKVGFAVMNQIQGLLDALLLG